MSNSIDEIRTDTVDSILMAYGVWIADSRGGIAYSEAKSALYDLMLAVIGEDEPEFSLSSIGKNSIEPHFRNELRAEQRTRLAKVFGREK